MTRRLAKGLGAALAAALLLAGCASARDPGRPTFSGLYLGTTGGGIASP